jgi:alpha-L-fucosidase
MKVLPNAEELNSKRDMTKYAAYMRNQLTELLTNYGKIDILWFDFSYKSDPKTAFTAPWMTGKGKNEWESEALIATARALQPQILINNRSDLEQDLWTPEQYQCEQWLTHPETGELVTWEACHTFSGSWGYYRDEQTWKSPEQLIALLVKTVSLGGNLLMNVGPTARGYFDHRADQALDVFAKWMRYNSRSIYNCTMAEPEFIAPNGCRLTQSEDGKRLYIHLLEYPFNTLQMNCLAGKIAYAQFLHDASEVKYHTSVTIVGNDAQNSFLLPTVKPDTIVPVIEVFLK